MNRAFVKDPDQAGQPEPLPERPQSPHPNYVTPAGWQALQEQCQALDARRIHLQALGRAADPGELAVVLRELRYVEARLGKAILVQPGEGPIDRVHFGSTVVVCDEAGTPETWTIVGEDEADPRAGTVSWVSPLAEALLHREVGDEVVWRRPAGIRRLEILEIRP